jgi:hypothetical protein
VGNGVECDSGSQYHHRVLVWWDFHAVAVCDTEPSLRHGGHSYAPVGERVLVVEDVALDVEVMRG